MPSTVLGADPRQNPANPSMFPHPTPDGSVPPGAPQPPPQTQPVPTAQPRQAPAATMLHAVWWNVDGVARIIPWWVWLGGGLIGGYYLRDRRR